MHGSFAPTQCSSHSLHSILLEDYHDILLASRLSISCSSILINFVEPSDGIAERIIDICNFAPADQYTS